MSAESEAALTGRIRSISPASRPDRLFSVSFSASSGTFPPSAESTPPTRSSISSRRLFAWNEPSAAMTAVKSRKTSPTSSNDVGISVGLVFDVRQLHQDEIAHGDRRRGIQQEVSPGRGGEHGRHHSLVQVRQRKERDYRHQGERAAGKLRLRRERIHLPTQRRAVSDETREARQD